MSLWDRERMDEKVIAILSAATLARRHHFGRPFMTPYQIAFQVRRRFPAAFRAINLQVGGKRSGHRESLAKYIARELSRRIRDGRLRNVEGRFLDRTGLRALLYLDQGIAVESSVQAAYHVSIFRFADTP